MRLTAAVLLASTILASGISMARADADAEPDANNIRVVAYSPLRRTHVIGIVGQPTTISFPENEFVYRVVPTATIDKDGNVEPAGWRGPDPASMEKQPLENNLSLWPVHPGQSTMTVITCVVKPDQGLTGGGCASSGGQQKVYSFRLVAIADDEKVLKVTGGIDLNLIFKGTAKDVIKTASISLPDPVVIQAKAPMSAAAAQAWRDRQKALVAAKEKLRADVFSEAGGPCHYTAKGKKPNSIEPKCPVDNGQWTRMRFPGLSRKPAVYIGSCENGKDDERLARQHETGDSVVVEEIAKNFCLRLGDDVLDIINDAFDPAGRPTGTGTIAPTVERDVIQARAQ